MIQIGLIGFGTWGPNLARCLAVSREAALAAVCDISHARLAVAHRGYPGIRLEHDWRAVVNDPRIDAVAIATPAVTHFELGIAALRAGKHVLVEKPLACSSKQALALAETAEQKHLAAMVDHTYLFSPPVRALHDMLAGDQFGEPLRYASARLGSGPACTDVSVLWDLAVHDLAMIDYLLPSAPYGIQAVGTAGKTGGLEHSATLTLFFSDTLKADVRVAWHAPAKCRRIQIDCSRGLLVFDDLEPIEKLRVFDNLAAAAVDGSQASRGKDSWSPRVEETEPLRNVTGHFVECIKTGRRPLCDGFAGLRTVRLLEAADRSLKADGRLIEVCQSALAE